MAPAARPITFLVPGQPQSSTSRGARQSIRVGAVRGDGGVVAVEALPGRDIVILRLADGPELFLHPENARDLLLAQSGSSHSVPPQSGSSQRGATRGSSARSSKPTRDTVDVPVLLQWSGLVDAPARRGATRGIGGVVLQALEVVTGPLKNVTADTIASGIVTRVDAQVDPGVYQLSAEDLPSLKGSTPASFGTTRSEQPMLVLVHGTFSTTAGTFGKLWVKHPDKVRSLFAHYGGRVYALDHPTLGVSPIANALTLAEALPRGARLHLLTHSRGGLVGEVLARVCANPDDRFSEFGGAPSRTQRAQLQALAALVRKRDIRVDRIVRVACPARGTLLASKRVDAYLSVFKWTLELAGIPVAPQLLDFLHAVAQRRSDPALMPGLAAQVPDSPLIRWLHTTDRRIDGQLRVIAGDLQGDSIGSWLKTLLTDAFYWTDHDLVVQTRSMYGGSPRQAASSFVLDQGGKVSHFGYFSNDRTARALTNALLQDAPQDFTPIGPLSWAGASGTGTRARIQAASAERPALFVLPGEFGSHLRVGNDRVWVSWRLVNGIQQLALTGPHADTVAPDGLVGSTYDDVISFLSASHDVVEFPFDWRRPLETEARRLATAVAAALDAREANQRPVRILAHSMGGLLARCLHLERPAIWKRLLAREGSRVLMLGTPNAGMLLPMQILSGDERFGNLLALAGAPFDEHGVREQLATFPGLLQLQSGLLDPDQPLATSQRWAQLAEADWSRAQAHALWHGLPIQREALRWGVPSQKVLDRAVALRRRLDAQRADLASLGDRLVQVVGLAPVTPDRFEMTDAGLVYTATTEGDSRVTMDSATLPGVLTWRVPGDHGELPARKDAFPAYSELLETGTTALIETVTPADTTASAASASGRADRSAARASAIYVRPAREARPAHPPRTEEQVLDAGMALEAVDVAAVIPPLRVTVHNGDLTFVPHPLLLGHYRSMRLTGTEHVMDGWIGHAMEQSLRVGTYPDAVGTNRIFINRRANPRNPLQMPRPQAVIVVGLGEEAKLRGTDLVQAIRQGALAWIERQSETFGGGVPEFELAATLIGSGGSGIAAGQAAQLVAQGVYEANERLAQDRLSQADDTRSPVLGRIRELHLIELYLDRASEALRALHLQADAMPGRFVVEPVVQTGTGGLDRPVEANYRGADYDFISALTRAEQDGSSSIEFTLDTRRARTEVRAQHTQSGLLAQLVASASNDTSTDARIGRTLFQLLVPIEIEPYLAGSTEMQIEVDSGTAGIPWELLDSDVDIAGAGTGRGNGAEPWAVRSKLLRKLRVENPPQRRDAGAGGSALIIGEPKCDPARYPRLAGARAEARQVTECLASTAVLGAERVEALIGPDDPQRSGPDAREIMNALFDRDRSWRIIHIAGHGEPVNGSDGGGVVLSDGFLSAREIATMRIVPELVFVNCCHLAARSGEQLLRGHYDRARFAAGVAEELISIGVRCVVAAGWAVDDAAASAFATSFYGSLLAGRRFIDAVSNARKAALTFGGNTWAAYQCYGDPDWTFRRDVTDAQRPSLDDHYQAVMSAAALARAVSTLAVQSEFQGAAADVQRDRLRFLEDKARHIAPRWLRGGEVAEAFGRASAAADDLAGAIRWYRTALAAPDGTASLKAAEQLANLRVRVAAEQVDPRNPSPAAIAAAREEIADAVQSLERLIEVHPTLERHSLLGSASKRLAIVEAIAGNSVAETTALERMQEHYRQAESLANDDSEGALFYPALNRAAAEVALNAARPEWKGLSPQTISGLGAALDARAGSDPDFWSVVGRTELRLYEALGERQLATAWPRLEEAWRDLHTRVSLDLKWRSVYDTARLVLRKYFPVATDDEREAATNVLTLLATFAGVNELTPDSAHAQRRTPPAGRRSQRKRPLSGKGRSRAQRKQVG